MKYIIINLSPRPKGTSSMLKDYFAQKMHSNANDVEKCNLYDYLKSMNVLLDKVKTSDSIVLIGPSYVCSYPADTINLLSSMSESAGVLHGQSLYGFIQGGMPYTHTHEHGIRLLENFAENNPVEFKGGFVMGGGAVLNGQPLEKIMGAKKMVPAVNAFIDHIIKDEHSSEALYKNAAMKIPSFITRILAPVMTRQIKKRFAAEGINYNAKSPYL